MIIQALNRYYERRQADPDPEGRLPSFGLEAKEIGFVLELDRQGLLVGISDLRRVLGNRKVGTEHLVPKGVKKTSGIAANLLWDNAEYVLALPDVKKLEALQSKDKGKAHAYTERLQQMQTAFRSRIIALPAQAQADAGIQAVLAFLDSDALAQVKAIEAFGEIAATNPVVSFRLAEEDVLICQRPGVVPHLVERTPDGDEAAGDESIGFCLATGREGPVERLHTSIKGVWGAQTSGANIVSFNLDAFSSYGKSQGGNATVGKAAAFAYTTALNALLSRESAQRVQVGDASTVFWAQAPDPMEDWLAELVGGDDPDAHTRQVKALYEALRSGGFDGGRGANRFYVLGLAPNAARISVRFWHEAPLSEVAARLATWFDDLAMARGPNDMQHPSLFRLLTAVSVQNKSDNIPPRLGGDIVRSIFNGTAYPVTWLNCAVQRCRAEQDVNHLRAAGIKACLTRSDRATRAGAATQPWEIKTMLDLDNPSAAYRLGRLFAVLEKIQEESSPGLNATIRDRYYGAASSTPVAVFTTLMRLKNHHLGKLTNKGRAVNFEKLLAEIMSGISDFPAHLALQEQGRFAIGYYHQRQHFYVKRDTAPEPTETTEGGN